MCELSYCVSWGLDSDTMWICLKPLGIPSFFYRILTFDYRGFGDSSPVGNNILFYFFLFPAKLSKFGQTKHFPPPLQSLLYTYNFQHEQSQLLFYIILKVSVGWDSLCAFFFVNITLYLRGSWFRTLQQGINIIKLLGNVKTKIKANLSYLINPY